MIQISGELTVRTINGRNGPFNVGRLSTSIGEFVIKDSQLDQFDEGKFSGCFSILEIRPASYFASGRLVVEVRARVSDMLFDDEVLGDIPADVPDLDPMEEESLPDTVKNQIEPKAEPKAEPELPQFGYQLTKPALDTTSLQPLKVVQAEDDEILFDMLWPLNDHVKLDSTVDRAVLRKQCARLKLLGYEFKSKSQTWEKVA